MLSSLLLLLLLLHVRPVLLQLRVPFVNKSVLEGNSITFNAKITMHNGESLCSYLLLT